MLAVTRIDSFLVVFAILFTVAAISLFRSKWTCIALWLSLFFYPHKITAEALPWNIGGDDLAVVIIFVIVAIHVATAGRKLILGPVAYGAIVLMILAIVGSTLGMLFSGVVSSRDYPFMLFLKGVLKQVRTLLVVLIVINSCRNFANLRLFIYSFLITIGLAYLVAIGQSYGIPGLKVFLHEHYLQYLLEGRFYEGHERFSGSFAGAWELGGTATIVGAISFAVLLRGRAKGKLVGLFGLLASVAGVIYAESRGAMVALGVALASAAFFTRRKIAAFATVGALIALLSVIGLFNLAGRRWHRAGIDLDKRVGLMVETVAGVPAWGYFTGVGTDVMIAYAKGKSHNLYLQIWLGMGLPGLILGVVALRMGMRSLGRSKALPQVLPGAALREGLGMAIVGIVVLGLSAEVIGSVGIREVFFAACAMFWSYVRLAREEEQFLYVDAEELPEDYQEAYAPYPGTT